LVRYSNKFHRPFEVSVSIPAHEFKDAFPEARIGDLYALRNSDLANQAVRYAKLINSRIVAVGSTQDDAFGDDKPSFWEAKNYEIKTGTEDRNLEILAPFQQLGWKKSDITLWGVKRKLPLASTWSCWNNGEKHCGSCQACVSRKDAFRIAKCGGDPTQYAG
jgi:7-cyano-7-deazaguanine synthase